MYIALLGRQPELSIAELEQVFDDVEWFTPDTALIKTNQNFDIQRLGGTQKAGNVVLNLPTTDWNKISSEIIRFYTKKWQQQDSKITLGISVYNSKISPREIQKIGINIKSNLKKHGVSLRSIPNNEASLSTATSHHNKLGLSPNKIELLIVFGQNKTITAESTGSQNITALAARDQNRPRRDAFVGMLPPKLALMMINLAGLNKSSAPLRLLDPFCGTGTLLQEGLLLGHDVYGTDLSEKMVKYSQDNLVWLKNNFHLSNNWSLEEADAIKATWQQPIDAVVSEAYLGQPFSAPPSLKKLTEVRGNCNYIISEFLKNLSSQIKPGTPVVLAIPAWKDTQGNYTHLPISDSAVLERLGFNRVKLNTVDATRLMYARPDQIVGREILLITKR